MPQIDLDQITVASPCTADWDEMQGDAVKRFCGLCELNVYNLSAMERGEAEAFVREAEGNVCVRMYKRQDGTLITQDCPVGLRAKLRRKLSWLAGVAASLLATVAGLFAGARPVEGASTTAARPLPVVSVMGSPVAPPPEAFMGDMVCEEPVEPVEPEEVEEEPEVTPPEPHEPRMGRIAMPVEPR